MTNPKRPGDPPTARRHAVKIDPWARLAASLLGLAGVGSGGTAVFITDIEAGPVALIVGGVLFLLVALAGVLPTRLKIGDNEAEWLVDELREFVAEVVDEAAPEDQDRLVERLADIDPEGATEIANRPEFVSINDLAVMLGRSQATIYTLRKEGKLPPPLHIGKNVRWRRKDIQDWIHDNQLP